MRSTWPVYHPTTGKCVKRNSTEKPSCYYRDGRIQCIAQKQMLGLDTCDTSSAKKWKYRGNVNQNIQDTSGNHWQIFSKDWTSSVISGKYSQNVHGYTPSINNKFTFSDGKEPGQVNISANKKYLINNTNTGDVKLVTTPSINTKERRYNFESPIFGRNNDILLNRWYTDPKLSSWKNETKKAFAYLLGNNQSMQKECCKRSGKYHQDLCDGWYGPSESCEALLSDAEKTNCCRGEGNQHACGKYWGPNKSGSCDNILATYCATTAGLDDSKCGCLWPSSKYDENVYNIGGPELDTRCNQETGYSYVTNPWTVGSNDHIDNNCKILFDRIANSQTIHFSDQSTLDSACSRYLAEEARKKEEEDALIRKLQAEEQERKFQASSIKDEIVSIASQVNSIKNKISELKSSVYAITNGLTSSMASNAIDMANRSRDVALRSVNMINDAMNIINDAINKADTTLAADALGRAKSALGDIQLNGLNRVEQAVNDAKAARQAALDSEEQKVYDTEESDKNVEEELLAKQKAEQESLLDQQQDEAKALLEQQLLDKQNLEDKLSQEQTSPDIITDEIKKLEEVQVEQQKRMIEVHEEQQKQIVENQKQELKDAGFSVEDDELLSTPVIIIIVVVVLLVILGIGGVLAFKFLR